MVTPQTMNPLPGLEQSRQPGYEVTLSGICNCAGDPVEKRPVVFVACVDQGGIPMLPSIARRA